MIVCVSVSHGNTKKVADVMGRALEAPVVAPEEVDVAELSTYDLVGFGSGVYTTALHPRLRELVQSLPKGERRAAFVYATSGFRETPLQPFTRPLVRLLAQRNFDVVGTFSCRAWDTWGPFRSVGGIRKGRPDAADLEAARAFAAGLPARIDARPPLSDGLPFLYSGCRSERRAGARRR
ncbi:flavodoxin family protein [Streptomyces sp. AN091965]|uniref:flavodoxin family protein n=1 Tax=Streptomyces sp. AN091965 TaxID=2927803 RepID=UPI001F604BCB|nr:flavodoxin family protein [Streptomyces sp. AN091965]MCI3928764.1 flavodoxin family protein [Streptomyces sp. AN091965]